ncbi:MAG: hypothetical protein FWD25_08240 [Clostridia bacterium]|nr:hypothetical protein [Clostridia bacterium]
MHNGYIVYLMRMIAEQGAIASLYCDAEDAESYQGAYIEQVNMRHAVIAAITPWGKLDGWWVRRTGDIQQALCGEEQELRLNFLLRFHNQRHAPLLPEGLPPDTDWMRAVLELAIQERRLVSLFTATETFTARPLQVDDLRVTVRALDLFGQPEPEDESFALRDIEALSIGTEEEAMYEILGEHFPIMEN